ncbi:hypothetical protein GLOIN_2v1475226 [Rhizophagus irregularis DAOM 181602=DAOM 197198]|uniref:Ion transport domain-containing protein n=1 Tax=Rhizophagus irregularis (strain DAOM 181602 / DAOM 197198 / MUCL 43194) TaxID=747089 RepID=A0A2P4QDG2_RHIID|nr:hypothetical protein GLOIN_2v1475226 [Rhizophagus irregularis DAOM 181602=DAOM 197198]POG75676.1 hypothetical protein GLOIN_2v1475226 [Rhizophagus irregularis DAOM 181602=DAOM 197198]|eukprot:XP_025182542.1 hypothetical protein GLOIN_2v1475226 [Rhizophagus irregularis DAOM 181602=DAOM 197198]
MSENYPRVIEVDARNENNNNNNNIFKNVINKIRIVNIFKSKKDPSEDVGYGNDGTIKKEDYQIAICQDGKFAVTFDTANLRVKILENTDHRQPRFNKKKEVDSSNQNESNGSVEIDKTIAYFKINDDFSINKYYKTTYKPLPFKETHGVGSSNSDDITKENISKKDDKFRWSFDISNMYKKNDTEYFILVSISRVKIDEDMKGTKEKNIKVTKLDYKREYLSSKKFKCSSPSDDCELDVKNNKFYETHDTAVDIQSVPKSENFNAPDDNILEKTDEIKKGISIYRLDFIKNKEIEVNYVLKAVTCYHSDVISGICKFIDSGEVDKDKSCDTQQRRFIILNFRGIYNFEFSDYCDYFDLNEKFEYPQSVRYELDNWFTRTDDDCDDCGDCMGRLISCIYNKYFLVTQYKNNVQSLEDYNFALLEELVLLSCIIWKMVYKSHQRGECPKGVMISLVWDLYNTGKVEISRLDNCPITRLARTSGNILLIEDNGKVSSVLKKVEENLKLKKVDYKMITNNKCHIDFKPVNDTEPWVLSNCERKFYCLYHNKEGTQTNTLQLIVGRSTVQIWHQIQDDSKNKDVLPNKGEPFLEYIWTNRIPVNQESEKTRLQIEEFTYDDLDNFCLKVYWHIKENNGVLKKKEKIIKQKDINEKFHAVRHACKALEHLNKRYKSKRLANNYTRVHKYEEMVGYIRHIVWRFAKHEPENFKLLDVRHNVMKSLILSDCNHLIKFILFGDEETVENSKENEVKEVVIRHIPRIKLWPGKKFLMDDDLDFDERNDGIEDNEKIIPENNMELAIYHCKGRELKDTIVIAYFLEYYTRHATDYAGWMCTVSKAIPLLFKYNYDDYARKLFYKECFADQDHFSALDPNEIIPEEYRERRNHNIKFRAFRPIIELRTDKYELYYKILNPLVDFKNKMIKRYENFDNNLGKSPLALRVVPLPSFTVNDIPRKKEKYNLKKNLLNIFLFLFIPRWYQIGRGDVKKLSPFSRMILYENNDDIYDNPATEAVVDFRWRETRNFFFLLFLRFLIFAICFTLVSWAYMDHTTIINQNFLLTLIIIFYYLAIYQLITEALQFHYRGFKKYFDFLSPSNTRFILLRNPTNIKIKDTTFSGNATNDSTNETFHIELKSDFDPKSIDNPFSSFYEALMAAYFWIGGDWVQRDEFSYWAVDLFTWIASIILVYVLLNMLIAFMTGVYEKAEIKGRQTSLRLRANHIADYEALHHINFWEPEPEPKNIYYFGQSKNFEEWYNTRKNQGSIYKEFEEKSTFTKHIFKESDYDKISIWKYDENDIMKEIEKITIIKNDLNNNIDYFIKKFSDLKNENDNDINNDEINNIINRIKDFENIQIKNILID